MAREGTEQKAIAQEELLELLMMIRRTARSLTTHVPGCMQSFASHPSCRPPN